MGKIESPVEFEAFSVLFNRIYAVAVTKSGSVSSRIRLSNTFWSKTQIHLHPNSNIYLWDAMTLLWRCDKVDLITSVYAIEIICSYKLAHFIINVVELTFSPYILET